MGSDRLPDASVAIIRVVGRSQALPVIRILTLSGLHSAEHVLRVTASADEAERVIGGWLRDVTRAGSRGDG